MSEKTFNDFDIQFALFELIFKKHRTDNKINGEIEEMLVIQNRTYRNRINGTTLLPLPEFYRLALHYDITLDDISEHMKYMPRKKWDPMVCSPHQESICHYTKNQLTYIPLVDLDLRNLKLFLDVVLEDLSQFLLKQKPHMKIVYAELSWFHVFEFEELAYFKMYTYYRLVVDRKMTFEYFVKQVKALNLEKQLQDIRSVYLKIHRQEIWGRDCVVNFLRMLEECHVCRNFEDTDTLGLLLDQLDVLINRLESKLAESDADQSGLQNMYRLKTLGCNGFVLMADQEGSKKLLLDTFVLPIFGTEMPMILDTYDSIFDALLDGADLLNRSSNLIKNEFVNVLRGEAAEYRARLLVVG